MFVLACVCLPVVPSLPVDDGVTEKERTEEYEGQYREPEPEDPYREQEAAAANADAYVSEGKFHPCEDV